MRIVTIVGARPQFIKALAISKECAARKGVEEVLLHTGQHYDENMSDVFFRGMGIPEPKYRFSLGSGSHGDMTGRQLTEIEKVLINERPDVCLVYGDTNSTLAGQPWPPLSLTCLSRTSRRACGPSTAVCRKK
jgi:UDP-GlcNAc3NAcA epimerase